MPRPDSIAAVGFEAHYKRWREDHPAAIPYDRLIYYVMHGDEFGRRVPIEVLAKAAATTRQTMLKWLPFIKQELNEKGLL